MRTLKKGFSLIELLVVIAIIGILAAVGTTGYQVYIDSTKEAVVKNNALTLLQAIANEDMAQSAGVGGYAECNDRIDLPTCIRDIVNASTLSNPYEENAGYGTTFILNEDLGQTLTSQVFPFIARDLMPVTPTIFSMEGAPCLKGNIALILFPKPLGLTAYMCSTKYSILTRVGAGAKDKGPGIAMSFFDGESNFEEGPL
tara:strand:- start:137 stop:736 length:600 start_codon:yes stop_codon:yes gene_type:complete